jgi:hypothetical protein
LSLEASLRFKGTAEIRDAFEPSVRFPTIKKSKIEYKKHWNLVFRNLKPQATKVPHSLLLPSEGIVAKGWILVVLSLAGRSRGGAKLSLRRSPVSPPPPFKPYGEDPLFMPASQEF